MQRATVSSARLIRKWLDDLRGSDNPFAPVFSAAQRTDRPSGYLLEYALHVLGRTGPPSEAESSPVRYHHFRGGRLRMKDVKLYTYWRSSCSWRVRILLHLKGVAFESAPIHLIRDGGEQRQEAFLNMHPIGQVPVLEWRDEDGQERRLGQSMAIALLLEDQFPEPAVLPADAYRRAQAVSAAEVVNAGTQPLQNLTVLQHVEANKFDRAAWAVMWIDRGLSALERQVRNETGPFLLGRSLSIADVFVVPQLYNARRFSLPLERFPRLLEAERACQALPAFLAAHPDVQPDAPQPSPH